MAGTNTGPKKTARGKRVPRAGMGAKARVCAVYARLALKNATVRSQASLAAASS